MPAAREEIARLRAEVSGEELARLNKALAFLSPEYDLPRLYALVKGATAADVTARGEVERHLHVLALSRRALTLYYGSREKMEDEVYGLSEAEIIDKAQSLN